MILTCNKNIDQPNSRIRGRSETVMSIVWPFLATYLPLDDIAKGIPLLLKEKT